jgi:hypothetical protein
MIRISVKKKILKEALLLSEGSLSNNLGFPKSLEEAFEDIFGNRVTTYGKWFKEYQGKSRYGGPWYSGISHYRSPSDLDLLECVRMLEAIRTGDEERFNQLIEVDEWSDRGDSKWAKIGLKEKGMQNAKPYLEKQLRDGLVDDAIFFTRDIVKDHEKIKKQEFKQYSKMSFKDASAKYSQIKAFSESKEIMTFDDGHRWLDVGPRCQFVGREMKNCGSTGVMSLDPDKTMLILVDSKNKPRIVATLSPNEKRLSGVEGSAGSYPKEEYYDHIVKLADFLDVKFDVTRSDSFLLNLKYLFRGVKIKIKQLKTDNEYERLYEIILPNKKKLYSDTNYFILEDEARKAGEILNQKYFSKPVNFSTRLRNNIKKILHGRNRQLVGDEVKYYTIYTISRFADELRSTSKQPIKEEIRKTGSKWCLYSKKKTKEGKKKKLGCYGTKGGAKKREKQVQYFKHKG